MNRLLGLLLLAATPLSAAAQYSMDRYHTKEGMARNRVASYDILELHEKRNGKMDSVVRETLTFDERGNLLSEYRTDCEQLQTYTYDSQDRLLMRTSKCKPIQRYEKDTLIYENGLLAKKISFVTDHGNDSRDTVEYTYTNGLLTEEKIIWACCGTRYWRHRYDEKGRLIHTDMNGSGTETFAYDENNNLVEYHYNDVLTTFEYDGSLRVKQTGHGAGYPYVRTFEYDANGLIRRDDDWFYRYRYR